MVEKKGCSKGYLYELTFKAKLRELIYERFYILQVKWLSFHSGYDFGYLINLLTNQNLPKTEADFFEQLKTYFPNVYDVKYLMKSCKNLKGGLQEVANELEVTRVGPQHQAGSDSLLTGIVFLDSSGDGCCNLLKQIVVLVD